MRRTGSDTLAHFVSPDITMYETLLRPHQVDAVPALPSISQISEKLKKSEQKREEKRLRQIANSRAAAAGKRKRLDDADDGDGARAEGSAGKRTKTDDVDDVMHNEEEQLPQAGNQLPGRPGASAPVKHTEIALPAAATETPAPKKTTVSKTFPEVRGHTSYLTFACLLPACPNAQATGPEDKGPITNSSTSVGVSLLAVPLSYVR